MSGFSKQSFSDLLLSLCFIIFIYSCFRRKWFRENRSFENYHEIYRCSNESHLEIGYRRVRCDYAHCYFSRIKCLLELNMIRGRCHEMGQWVITSIQEAIKYFSLSRKCCDCILRYKIIFFLLSTLIVSKFCLQFFGAEIRHFMLLREG